MTFKELGKISYGIIEAAPYGRIDTKEQYDYMIHYDKETNLGFYHSDKDRHIPTFEECKGRYLDMTSFFGGASFFFIISNRCVRWNDETKEMDVVYPEFNYGTYGKIM